jgi:signal transduction histidine kinase
MDRISRNSTLAALVLLGVGMATLFVIDVSTPPGVADGVGYPILLVLSMWLPWRGALAVCAWTATFLITIGAIFGTQGGIGFEASLVNRGIAFVTVWVVWYLLAQRATLERRLHRSEERSLAVSAIYAELSGNIARELRPPLDAIVSFAAIVGRQGFGPVGDARYVEQADAVHADAANLRLAIRDMLQKVKDAERKAVEDIE